ncbi:hypothetical protein ES708_34241 [subsurface metagenome]
MSGVSVKQYSLLVADATDIFNILDGAYLLVGMLDGNQNGFVCNRIPKLIKVHKAIAVHIQIGHFKTLFLKGSGAIEYGKILNFGYDYVFPLLIA